MKTKIKSYGDEARDFPKAGSDCTCLAVINVDLTFKKDENFYPQVYLKEYKYTKKND